MPYISGTMRSKRDDPDDPWWFKHFFAEELRLRDEGVTDISNPARIDMEQDGFDPLHPENAQELDMAHYAQRDMDEIIAQKGLVRLRGWEESMGAKAECAIAQWLKKPISDAPEPTPEMLARAEAEIQKVREAYAELQRKKRAHSDACVADMSVHEKAKCCSHNLDACFGMHEE